MTDFAFMWRLYYKFWGTMLGPMMVHRTLLGMDVINGEKFNMEGNRTHFVISSTVMIRLTVRAFHARARQGREIYGQLNWQSSDRCEGAWHSSSSIMACVSLKAVGGLVCNIGLGIGISCRTWVWRRT
ncbi:hypothetical protein F0562_008261 [Nyssa sinensis]|uniref:Uncharacterized protein n=1 Tax=Nyssa sinensis TaxID=561372 RepID=A0A5J5A9P2_9ASTE|nr:hypothetical protein F0562_008261 [Nyssa sinensis]